MVAITQSHLRTFEPVLWIARPPGSAVVYRRRRRVVILGAALVLVALVLAVVRSLPVTPSPFAGEPVASTTHVVEPGDTVWSLAVALAPGADPRALVDVIVEANGGADLVVGQRVVLPPPP